MNYILYSTKYTFIALQYSHISVCSYCNYNFCRNPDNQSYWYWFILHSCIHVCLLWTYCRKQCNFHVKKSCSAVEIVLNPGNTNRKSTTNVCIHMIRCNTTNGLLRSCWIHIADWCRGYGTRTTVRSLGVTVCMIYDSAVHRTHMSTHTEMRSYSRTYSPYCKTI